jgi:transcriptional regulator with XRE-family HTH domain
MRDVSARTEHPIGAAIRQAREQRDLRPETVAVDVGVSTRTLARWETGRTVPDALQLVALAYALDTSTAQLTGEVPSDARHPNRDQDVRALQRERTR